MFLSTLDHAVTLPRIVSRLIWFNLILRKRASDDNISCFGPSSPGALGKDLLDNARGA